MKNHVTALAAALLLCLGICGGLSPRAGAFSDAAGEVAEAAEVLYALGIVSGYPDGEFHPEDGLTRAQFCKLAVLAGGYGDRLTGSAWQTRFSDVPASGWAAPYVNLACEEGLIAGYADGTFGPDDPVTVAQAATIVLRLLGYTTAEIGPFWPEDYLSRAGQLGLLEGIETSDGAPLSRGDAAVLLYRLLRQETVQGKVFYTSLAASAVEGAVVLDTDAEAPDGTLHTVKTYAEGGVRYYPAGTELPDRFAGMRGVLLLDKSGAAAGFLPGEEAERKAVIADTDASGITDGDGRFYAVAGTAPVLLEDERLSYAECWYELSPADEVTLYYGASGGVALIWVRAEAAGAASALTGYYEDAQPNVAAPETVTVLGAELSVSEEGRAALRGFSIGDRVTLTLDGDGRVIGAVPAGSDAAMVGVLKSGGSDRVEVTLAGGVTVAGESASRVSSELAGSLVRVSSGGPGKISVSSLSLTGSADALDVKGRTLGDRALSGSVRLYERVGESPVREIALDDILTDTVPAERIEYVGTDGGGAVELLLLSDVTGDGYTYGILDVGLQTVKGQSYGNLAVSVENGDGVGTAYITTRQISDGAVGGVAGTAAGKTAGVVLLTELEGISRSDFSGADSVAGLPISGEVQVYNTVTGKWTTLAAARAFTDRFTVYYDRTPETGGQVRVIFAQ